MAIKTFNTPYLDENIARNIRKMRRERQFTQEFMAAKLGMSTPAYSKIETGITDVNLSRLEQIAAIFEVPLTQLFAGDEPIAIQHLPSSEYLEPLKRIESYETEILDLQRKVIELYDELRRKGDGYANVT